MEKLGKNWQTRIVSYFELLIMSLLFIRSCYFSMKSFQTLLPSGSAGDSIDKSPKINDIKKATHDLLWKYLRGHVKREQTLQVWIFVSFRKTRPVSNNIFSFIKGHR